MKTKNMLVMAGAGMLAYYLLKRKSASGNNEGPGVLNRFVDRVKESVGKDLDEIGDDIHARPGMKPSMNG